MYLRECVFAKGQIPTYISLNKIFYYCNFNLINVGIVGNDNRIRV